MSTRWCSSGLILVDVNKLINDAICSLLVCFDKLFKFKLTCLFSTCLAIIKVLFDHLILNFCILLLSSIAFTSMHLLAVLVLFQSSNASSLRMFVDTAFVVVLSARCKELIIVTVCYTIYSLRICTTNNWNLLSTRLVDNIHLILVWIIHILQTLIHQRLMLTLVIALSNLVIYFYLWARIHWLV